jgi:Uma2 family endonuclease
VVTATANVRLGHMDSGTSNGPTPTFRRFTADEAMRMVELGIVGEDEHVELLDGAFVEMSPQGPPHTSAIMRLAKRLRAAYEGRADVREEKPLATGQHNLPEPDIAVVQLREDEYSTSHPNGREAVLVVELAYSSQHSDRRKASIYAVGNVRTLWLLDLVARRLEVRTLPATGAYQVVQILGEDDTVALPESSERWIVGELLPAA